MVESEPEQHEGEGNGSANAVTDSEGRYELVVPAGRHAVTAGGGGWLSSDPFGRPGLSETPYAKARVGGLVVAENGHVRGIDLRLEEGGVLEGTVRGADGSPASDAWVWAMSSAHSHENGGVENGHFRMRLAPGSYLVGAASRQDVASAPASVEIVSGETRHVELALQSARIVSVTVRAKGALVGCELEALDEHGRRQLVDTEEDGKFWIGPLVPGKYTLRGQRDGKEIERALEVTAGSEEMKLELAFD